MRSSAFFTLLVVLLLSTGCGKNSNGPPPDENGTQPVPQPSETPERDKLLAALKGSNQEAKRNAMDDLAVMSDTDAVVVAALLEMLKDKTTAGPGRTLPNQINSTREAAALTLSRSKSGEAALKQKGLATLSAGLTDSSAAIREHTVYTIGQLGALGTPLAGNVQKLCTDSDSAVRGAAFDALRLIGIADLAAMAKLLRHENNEVARLAAELIPLVQAIPDSAIEPLSQALESEDAIVRSAAAEGLARSGARASSAVPQLIDAIKKSYPATFDSMTAVLTGPEMSYWKALSRIGEAAVAPTSKLLEHTNVLVRALAVRTLGEVGEPAKNAKDALKKSLGDTTINVAVEAAVALVKIGEPPKDSLDLMKRGIDARVGAVAAYTIEAIPRLGDAGKELIPLALEKMGDANPATRAAVVWLVGQLPSEQAKTAATEVGKRATDEFPEIRRLAGAVLEQLGRDAAPAAEILGAALTTETESDIRGQFVEALIAMREGAKPAIGTMLALLTDRSLSVSLRARLAIAAAVADPGSSDVSAALVKIAGDTDQTLRIGAADALGILDPLPGDALAALVKMAKSDARTPPRTAALRAIVAAGPRAKNAKGDLETIAGGQMPGLALWAKVALAAIDDNLQKAAPAVRVGLIDRSSPARAAAAEALLLIGPTKTDLPTVRNLLKDANGTTRAAAARNLGKLGADAKEEVPQLIRLLDDREADVRIAAAEALGNIGSASRPALAKLRELRADPLAGTAARKALEKIDEK